ncbi:AI-2E family transporter [Blastococcus capsensis]|uniref:AI-2E family transporter n=1 Tax=Blastococcus capsensis TaxID=1564163 RepID=UPI00253FF65D|nr:AI-2E family transporter [Blastococcus capsensis]MDK3257658.1 AI-2E family transporter [Blastococcus capsensis]
MTDAGRTTVPGAPAAAPGQLPAASPWRGAAGRLAVRSVAVLGVAAVGWLVMGLLVRLSLVTLSLIAALLLTALAVPLTSRLRRIGAPPALAAAAAVLSLVAVLGGVGTLVWFRTSSRLTDLTPALAAGIDRVRGWLVTGPLGLDPERVAGLRDRLVARLAETTPSPVAGAEMALTALGAMVLVLFVVFFLVKDGGGMWAWVVERVPGRQRERTDGAGRQAWSTLSSYVLGVVTVAAIDALLIGLGLFVLGVPLWLSLTLLTFFGAFVPYFGALLSGAAAVLVTLVTDGPRDAVIILVVVLVVQQLEGNVLQPLIMRRAVHLHPVVTLLVITAGTLLFGIAGAVVAVPITAVAHHVLEYLRTHPPASPGDPPADPPDTATPPSEPGTARPIATGVHE